MIFFHSLDKKRRRQAEVIHFSGWAGFTVGQKYAMIQSIPDKTSLTRFLHNEHLMDPARMDQACLDRHRQLLLKRGIEVAIGYPSSLALLAHYCQRRGDQPSTFRIQSVICLGEALSKADRSLIEAVFGCRVFNRYAATEFGVLAHECTMGRQHINESSYLVEVLDPHSEQAALPGTVGRIVVTDLFSHAMPLIRYDTGDLGATDTAPCPCGCPAPVLAQLEGRLMEQIYDAEGDPVSPFVIHRWTRDLAGVKRFQFIQHGPRRYEMLLCVQSEFRDELRISRWLRSLLGSSATIDLSYVDEIAPLPSGKRPYIMNTMAARGRAPHSGGRVDR
jgi:phenylacetate-coenzyme A ligase PaaK-like adenylate-forming protein